MNPGASCFVGILFAAAVAAGCARNRGDAHQVEDGQNHAEHRSQADGNTAAGHPAYGKDEKGGEEEPGSGGGVAFMAGRGLTLNADVRNALSLKTAPVSQRLLADNLRLLAQVFAVKPKVLASATVPADHQQHFTRHSFKDAKLLRMVRSATGSRQLVDLVVELERTPPPTVGDFVDLDFGAEPSRVLAVPASALLDAAAGTFVYVVSGEHYLRTPVKIGARSAGFVEIADGLDAGDVVVSAPVEQLWLAELRLTKGGGHSH